MNKFKIINEPYYVGNGCDCCEGWWYDNYFIELNGEFIEYTTDPSEYNDCDTRISFYSIEEAKAHILDNILAAEIEVVDEGHPDYSSIYNEDSEDFDESSYD